jgi:type VI secretion system secreted protein VgrG
MPEGDRESKQLVHIKTPLGEDVLIVKHFSVHEGLGRLFEMDLDLVSIIDDKDVNFDDIMGKNATVSVELPNGETRFFNGFVNRFAQTGYDKNYAYYHATLVPWLWFLTRRADCRVFQKTMPEPPSAMTAPGIIKKVFKDRGYSDFEESLNETYREFDYCVQYRETDFNFVSRLMEQEGIYYFFKHEDGKHTLVLADSINVHRKSPNYETIQYEPGTMAKGKEVITDWVMSRELQSGKYVLNDFDFLKPTKPLRANANSIAEDATTNLEVYDYPGDYSEFKDGETYARRRIEELHAKHEVASGRATAQGLCSGFLFSLEGMTRKEQDRDYLITGTAYHFETGASETDESSPAEPSMCTFTAIPSTVPYRSARITPKPVIQGVQTAIVVGPKGDEIYTDEHARVKVQFHWDRVGKNNENSSCWVRVSQANAGKGWGSMITPRIGQEVIVEFLEGDPDRPIITGRVYNGDQKAPYHIGQGVVSGLKSNTHKGSGYNEMSMDDTAGKEKITIHGQYDMNTTVQNDQFNTVNNKFTEKIKSDALIEITQGKLETTVQGKISTESKSDEILIKAATKITLETGASKITMEAGGTIKIEGVDITINGKAQVTTKAAQVTSDASGINNVKAGGMVQIKGAMVQVN